MYTCHPCNCIQKEQCVQIAAARPQRTGEPLPDRSGGLAPAAAAPEQAAAAPDSCGAAADAEGALGGHAAHAAAA